jgi:hypothetical protein
MSPGPIGRHQRARSSLGLFVTLAALASACSGGGMSVDVEREIAADTLVTQFASQISRAPSASPLFTPHALGVTIAAAVDDLIARSDDDFRAAGGISRRDLANAVGSLMGELATAVFKVADGHGRRAVVETTAYALELGSAVASESASGPGDAERLGWLVPSAAALSERVRTKVNADLDARDFDAAAKRLIDELDKFGPFQVFDAVERQLERIVPADDLGYPRDDLRRAFHFVVSLAAINTGS